MAMTMDQMQANMARMHQQNYNNDMQLARHFQDVSRTYNTMAQNEYQMYQMHMSQAQGMPQGTTSHAAYTPLYGEVTRY